MLTFGNIQFKNENTGITVSVNGTNFPLTIDEVQELQDWLVSSRSRMRFNAIAQTQYPGRYNEPPVEGGFGIPAEQPHPYAIGEAANH